MRFGAASVPRHRRGALGLGRPLDCCRPLTKLELGDTPNRPPAAGASLLCTPEPAGAAVLARHRRPIRFRGASGLWASLWRLGGLCCPSAAAGHWLGRSWGTPPAGPAAAEGRSSALQSAQAALCWPGFGWHMRSGTSRATGAFLVGLLAADVQVPQSRCALATGWRGPTNPSALAL